MKNRLALAFLLLLSIASLAFAEEMSWEGSRGRFEMLFGTGAGSWMPLAIAAIMICVIFNTLTYMAGVVFQSEHLKKYAEGEFLQVTASAMLIFFGVALLNMLMGSTGGAGGFFGEALGGASTVSCSAVSSGSYAVFTEAQFGGGPLGAFKCKIQEKITALDMAYNNVFAENMPLERFTSLCISIFGVPVYCGDWSIQQHQQVEMNHLIATKIVGLLMPLHAEYVLVEYIQNNMLAVFLPLGLLLRIFPITRGVGGLFIAMAIGFYFVFPFFYIVTDPTYVKADQKMTDMQQGMCFTGFSGAAVVLSSQYVGAFGTGLALGNASDLVFQLTIATMFYPFVAFVIAMIFIRAVTPLLGGDTGELMKMAARLG